jgi:disulfide oxidoreductase YuzD
MECYVHFTELLYKCSYMYNSILIDNQDITNLNQRTTDFYRRYTKISMGLYAKTRL